MSEEKKVPQELELDELEQVNGGYTTTELIMSREMAVREGNCPIEAINSLAKRK